MTPSSRVKTWIWVVIGVIAVGILCVIALAGAGIWFVRTHINIQPTTATAATTDFQSVRERFSSQKPLIELDDRGNFVHANTERPNGPRPPDTLNVMVFDARDERVVRMDIPFWLLRLKAHGDPHIRVAGNANIDLAKMRLTVEDLERFGPTLIVDHKDVDGSRVIVWSQ